MNSEKLASFNRKRLNFSHKFSCLKFFATKVKPELENRTFQWLELTQSDFVWYFKVS